MIIGLLGVVLLFTLGSAAPNFHSFESNLIINKIEINITGLSTVGKYNCSTTFFKKDTIVFNVANKNCIKAEIPMVKFDCGNRIMTKDLQATVKTTQFPSSFVTITDIKAYGNNYKCNLNFLITNKTLRYKDFILTKDNNKLQGAIALNFSDIGLVPPVKMGGLIKVKDEIAVNFSLHKF
nr:hypothetical protein [uncultured Flavobacterium sp.]